MNDLAWRDRSYIGRIEGHDRNGVTRERREFNFIAGTLLMHQYNGANITSGQPLFGQIALQDDEIQFIDHGVAILLGTNVTRRGAVP